VNFKAIIVFGVCMFAQLVFAQTIPITELSTNKASYVAGDRAVLLASVRRHPTGYPNDEVYVEGTLNGQPIKMLSLSGYHAAYVTAELPAGSYVWETKVYTRNMIGAEYYRNEIAQCDAEEIRLKRLFEDETDAAKKSDLTTAINENAVNKAFFQNLLSTMKSLRDTKSQTFIVDVAKKNSFLLDPMVLSLNHINPVYYQGQSSTLKATIFPSNITSDEALEFQVRGEFDGLPFVMESITSTEFSGKIPPSMLTLGSHSFAAHLYARSQHNSNYLRIALNFTISRKFELAILRDTSSNSALSAYYQREIDELEMLSEMISDIQNNSLVFVATAIKSIDVQSAVLSQISVGEYSACSIKAKSLSCWGADSNSILGNVPNKLVPTLMPDLGDEVTQVSTYKDTCAVKNGTLYCWGRNVAGTVGNNSQQPVLTPLLITIPGTVQKVSQGSNHACAVSSGSLYCWGSNSNGQFGNGNTTASLIPKLITLSEAVTEVEAGDRTTCVITVTQKLLCFGMNSDGQVGDGTITDRTTPFTVFTSGVTAVSTRASTSCAIVSGGAKCWGLNLTGRLGNGTTTLSTTPVNVTGMSSGVSSISVGGSHTCLVANGAAKCMGYSVGILGDGTPSDSFVKLPGSVYGMGSDVDQISAGHDFTCLRKLGNVHCWGKGLNGQLGSGSASNSLTILQPVIPLD